MYNQSYCSSPARTREINFYGAALVNEDGIEIPITAEMVEKALLQAYGSVGTAGDHHTSN